MPRFDPNRIDVTDLEPIAFATSNPAGDKLRWTELSVFHLPDGPWGAKRWLSRSIGRSAVPGEQDRGEHRQNSASLERALRLFSNGHGATSLGHMVSEEATEWAEDNGLPLDLRAGTPVPETPRAMRHVDVPEVDVMALAWLYGGDEKVAAMARDLGVGESTMRAAIRDGHDLRIGLRAILPFVDRRAFRTWSAAQRTAEAARTAEAQAAGGRARKAVAHG